MPINIEFYNISQEDVDAAKEKYINGSNKEDSMKAILDAVSTGELKTDVAKYLLADISVGDTKLVISQLQNMTPEEQKVYARTLFDVFSNKANDTSDTDKTVNIQGTKPAETLDKFLESIDDPQTREFYERLFENFDYEEFFNRSDIPQYFQTVYTDAFATGTIRSSGCGITSLAMIATYLTGEKITPDMLTNGYRGDNPASAMEAGFKKLNLVPETYRGQAAIDNLDVALDNGYPVIINVRKNSIFTEGGHFIVIAGKTEDGKYIVNDPNIENYYNPNMVDGFTNGFTRSEITTGMAGIYIFKQEKAN